MLIYHQVITIQFIKARINLSHMKPNIRMSGKGYTFSILLAVCLVTLIRSSAQTCGGTLGSVTYDTVFVSFAPGASWNMQVQQLPPSKTLYAVVFKSSFTIVEGDPGSAFFANGTGSPVSSPQATIEHDGMWSVGTLSRSNSLAPVTDAVTHVPFLISGAALGIGNGEWLPFSEPTLIPFLYDSLTPADASLANFIGSSPLFIGYSTTSSLDPTPIALNAVANFTTTEHVTLTYYYCDAVLLALDPLTFTATRHGDQQVDLTWSVADERPGRKYDIQLSRDGSAFSTYTVLATEPGDRKADYSYHYIIPAQTRSTLQTQDNLYFRLKESVPGSLDRYSSIQVLEVSKTTRPVSLSVYPNPAADFVQLLLPEPGSGWQVDILHADGGLVQSDRYGPASFLRVDFRHKMASGTYFVRATDLGGEHSYSASFFVGKK